MTKKLFGKKEIDHLESGIHVFVEDLIEMDDKNTSLLYIRGDDDEDIATVMMYGEPEMLAEIIFDFMEDDKVFHRFIKRIHQLENERRIYESTRNN